MYDVQYNKFEVINMESKNDLISSLTVELKRGTLVLLVLSQLRTQEYGYSLVQKLEESKAPIEAGTLYPLLRRLEKQNLLVSEWDTSVSRPRKFYKLSEEGMEVYKQLKKEWRAISGLMDDLLKEEEEHEID